MASSKNASTEIEVIIEEVKNLIAKACKLIFDTEYDSLFKIAFDATNDREAARFILDESYIAILESGLILFRSDDVKSNLKLKIEEICLKHKEEVEAKKEFLLFNSQAIHFDNSWDEDVINAAVEEFHKLPPKRKRIFFETLLSGSTPRKVAENNKMDTEKVLKMNWKTRQILKKKLVNKIR